MSEVEKIGSRLVLCERWRLLALAAVVGLASVAAWAGEAVVSPELAMTLEGHLSVVEALAFSPDGTCLASGGGYTDGTVKLWDPATGDLTRTLLRSVGRARIASLVFSPDGKLLAVASSDGTVKLCGPVTGDVKRTLRGHDGGVNGVAFAPDGTRLVSASDADAAVRMWNLADGALLYTKPVRWGAKAIAWSPDGALLAGVSRYGRVPLWNASKGLLRRYASGGKGQVTLAFSPDSTLLASGGEDQTVKLWNPRTGAVVRTLQPCNAGTPVAFAPSGTLLASASDARAVQLWEPQTGKLLRTLTGHSGRVWSLAFSPDGKLLASGSDDRTVKLWNVAKQAKH